MRPLRSREGGGSMPRGCSMAHGLRDLPGLAGNICTPRYATRPLLHILRCVIRTTIGCARLGKFVQRAATAGYLRKKNSSASTPSSLQVAVKGMSPETSLISLSVSDEATCMKWYQIRDSCPCDSAWMISVDRAEEGVLQGGC